MSKWRAQVWPAMVVTIVVLAVVLWAMFVVLATTPDGFSESLLRRAAYSVESAGAFGDSFGALTACFSGLAVVLVYLTFALQKNEFEALQRHLAADERIKRWESLLARLQQISTTAQSGSKTGHDLLDWMDSELRLPMAERESDANATRASRWQSLASSSIPDTECLEPAAECLVGLSRIYVASRQEEREAFVSSLRTVIGRRHLRPLLLACARRPSGTEGSDSNLERLLKDLGYLTSTIDAFGVVDTSRREAALAGWHVE